MPWEGLLCKHFQGLILPQTLKIENTDFEMIIQSRTDLAQISKLINLGVLTIGRNLKTSDIGLDDSTSTFRTNSFLMSFEIWIKSIVFSGLVLWILFPSQTQRSNAENLKALSEVGDDLLHHQMHSACK